MTPAAELRRLLEPLPPDTMVRVGWVLECLSAPQGHDRQSVEVEIDLTVEDVATLLQRKAPTVRAWCAAGLFPGAWRLNGKQWRIPRAGIAEFQRQQSESSRCELK